MTTKKKVAKKKDVQTKAGVGATTVTHPDKSVSQTQEEVKPGDFEQPTANVGVSLSFTKNLGNYESLRMQVSVNLPCYVEELDDVHEFAKKWAHEKMEKLVEETTEGSDG